MNKILVTLALVLSGMNSMAQTTHYTCGSSHYANALDAQHPGIKAELDRIAEHGNYKTRGTTVTIPIVFHVVYKNTTQNLSDAYLSSQVELLNQCYGRTNADTSSMRSIYQSRVGASKIRFVIDQIKRVSTTASFDASSGWAGFTGSDAVKQTANGGSDAVSPSTKLNVWICDLTMDGSDGLVGYAYPPAGAPLWPSGYSAPAGMDGVIVDYTDIGGISKHPIGYSGGFRGKALVHEIGHYLGLRHVWGDDGGACQGDAGYFDDGLSDTPVAADATSFNCNKAVNTCIEASGDLPDMLENYMDYSSATCQNSFTKMQVNAMEYVLDNIRTTVRVPLAVNELEELSKKFTIYPNPASNELYIDIRDINADHIRISLLNTLGQTMYSTTTDAVTNQSTIDINTSHLTKGMYMISIQVDEQSTITKKIIIQ